MSQATPTAGHSMTESSAAKPILPESTIRALRQRCQPRDKGRVDPLMEWHLLRPLSIYITWLCIRLRLRAGHVSLGCFLSAAAGSALLMTGDRVLGLVGAGLAWFSFLLDCVDGEVARYRGSSSVRGTYLDYLVGGVNDGLILLGLAFYVTTVTGWDARLVAVPSAMLALSEKLIGLYVHSVVFRNCRAQWQLTPDVDGEGYAQRVWFRMSLPQRLLRVPFETFFRVTLILAALVAATLSGYDACVVVAWALALLLGAVLCGKTLFSELFGRRVEQTMDHFVRALKGCR